MPNFKVITYGWDRHAGLRHDAELLKRSLVELGHKASILKRSSYRTFAWRVIVSSKAQMVGADRLVRRALTALSFIQRRANRKSNDVVIHIQYPALRYLISGATQVFVPNPEWFWDRDAWALPFIDVVLCKTRHAVPTFSAAGCTAEYVGFTSEDCQVRGIRSDRSRWLHIASNGHQKGTDEIVDAWHRHPEWPDLTILAHKRTAPTPPAKNLHVINDWVDDTQLRRLMQISGVHLCPSNAEGFGHTIVEAMSCGVLVVTTDLAPMNELVDESRGVLVDVAESKPMGWARRAQFTQAALEDAVERVIGLSDTEFMNRAAAARQWYVENDAAFKRRLGDLAARLEYLADSTTEMVT